MSVTQIKKKKGVHTGSGYLSSSDGRLGLLSYRLVTETAYQQPPRPFAHAHREGLIWIFEGKTHTPLKYTHTHTCKTTHKSWPVIALHCWLRLLSPGVTASRWLPLSCQRRPRAHTQSHTASQIHRNTLSYKESLIAHKTYA